MSKKFKVGGWEKMLELYSESQAKRENGATPAEIPNSQLPDLLETSNLVRISKIVFGKNFSLVFLSNGNFQAIFKDQLEVFFCKENQTISITKDGDFDMVYSLNNFIFIDNSNLWKRISFINNTIKSIQQNQFELDIKHSRHKHKPKMNQI